MQFAGAIAGQVTRTGMKTFFVFCFGGGGGGGGGGGDFLTFDI